MATTTKTQTCTWKGATGKDDIYNVHKLPVSFNGDQYGNYIYTKINANRQWVPIYIGEGDLGDRVSNNHHKATCIAAKGATHVQVHLTGSKAVGTAEEKDLLARYANTFLPTGCNKAPGG